MKWLIGKGSDWLKTGLSALGIAAGVATGGATAALAGGAVFLGKSLVDIRDRHKASGASPLTLAELFYDELTKHEKKWPGRIVLSSC